MQSHPFIESITGKAAGVLWIGLVLCIEWGLLAVYGSILPVVALMDSVVYTSG